MEDAYSFATSFSFRKKNEEEMIQEQSSLMDDIELLPAKLQAERNPVTEFEIDFESLDKYQRAVSQSFENEDDLIKQIELLVQLLSMQFSETHKSVDSAFMVWRASIMLLNFLLQNNLKTHYIKSQKQQQKKK